MPHPGGRCFLNVARMLASSSLDVLLQLAFPVPSIHCFHGSLGTIPWMEQTRARKMETRNHKKRYKLKTKEKGTNARVGNINSCTRMLRRSISDGDRGSQRSRWGLRGRFRTGFLKTIPLSLHTISGVFEICSRLSHRTI